MKTNFKVTLGLVILLTTGCSTVHSVTPVVSNHELITSAPKSYINLMRDRITKCKELSDAGKECTEVNMSK